VVRGGSVLASVVAVVVTGCFINGLAVDDGARPRCSEVIAHRAGGQEVGLVDNSWSAIYAGQHDRLDILEVDVRWSADGRPFLFHDRRLTSGSWEVPPVFVGVEFSSVSSDMLERICSASREECLLPLESVLDRLLNFNVELQLDLKDPRDVVEIGRVMSEVLGRSLTRRVIIFCDPISECEAVRELSKSIRIMARAHTENDLDKLLLDIPWAVQIDEELLTPPNVEPLRARGVRVMVKTLDAGGDTPQRWIELRRRGADMVLTDRPRAARETLCATSGR